MSTNVLVIPSEQWDGHYVIVRDSDVPPDTDMHLVDEARPDTIFFMARSVWHGAKRSKFSILYRYPTRMVPCDQLSALGDAPFLLGYVPFSAPDHVTLDELHDRMFQYMRLVCDALTTDPPCDEAMFYDTYKDLLESRTWRQLIHLVMFVYVIMPAVPVTMIIEEGSESIRPVLVREWLRTEEFIGRATLMARFKDTKTSLAFLSLYEPDMIRVSATHVRLTPMQALVWNKHDPTDCVVPRDTLLRDVLPAMNTQRIYQRFFLDWIIQWKHKLPRHDARIRQAGLDLAGLIRPILLGKATAMQRMHALQTRLHGAPEYVNQQALKRYTDQRAAYDAMRKAGKWTPPLTSTDRKSRLAIIPDMEDLFHPTQWSKLAPCMQGVLAQARETGHLLNDGRQALAEWLVYSRPSATWDSERHMGRIHGQFEGANHRSMKMAIHYVIEHRDRDMRYTCRKIIKDTSTRPPASRLACPYVTDPQHCCTTQLNWPMSEDMTVRIESPLDSLLHVHRI